MAPDAMAGASAGSVTVSRARRGGRRGCGRPPRCAGREAGPQAADGPHHDRVVEEHQRQQDGAHRLVDAQESQRPRLGDERLERHAHHDGRQDERHGHERAQRGAAGNRVRYSTHAPGIPSTTHTTVASVAWVRVRPTIRHVRGLENTASNPASVGRPSTTNPRPTRDATGHAKKIPRNASGTTTASATPRA